jgi:hypothetical protein
LCWSPAPKPGRTLFVVFAYHGQDGDSERRGLLERFESQAGRGHRIVHRDHYANPRPFEYQLALVRSASAHTCSGEPADLVVDRKFEAALSDDVAREFGRVAAAPVADAQEWTQGMLAERRTYDHLVLVYSDALGLGCDDAERNALGGRDSVLVLNGRRRAFRLTRALRLRLRFSRWLAGSRVLERTLAVLIQPFAATLAWTDSVTRRS